MRAADTDGRFEVFFRDGWACLVVHPPAGSGRPVYHEEVVSRLRLLGAPAVSSSRVREIVEQASGNETRLVAWPGGKRLAATVRVTVTDDEMSATIFVTHPLKGAAAPGESEIRSAIGAAGICAGVDEQAIRRVLSGDAYDTELEIASGTPPVHARSARVIYHFDVNRGKPYLVMEFDRINLRELRFIEFKEKGEVLAELQPAAPPSDGITVLGRAIPAKDDPVQVSLSGGSGTRLSEDGSELYADEDGNVKLNEGVVVVEPVVTVERVDYATGNIRFEGAVVVERDVADGFVIDADGDVQVGEGVGRATIRSRGNVLLQAGVNAAGEGEIEAAGNIFAKYVEGARVLCHGNLLVEEAIMHSAVTVWGNCALSGRRAEIIGSTVIVGQSLWCKKLGSVAEAPVTISAGIDPSILIAYRESHVELTEMEEREDVLSENLAKLEKAGGEGRTDSRLADAREQLARELSELREQLPAMRHAVHEMRDRIQASRSSRIVVEDTIHNGVQVQFGSQEYRSPPRGARKTILRRGLEGVEEEGFNPSDPPAFEFDAK